MQNELYQLENKQAKSAKRCAILDRRWRAKNAPKLSSKYLVHGIEAKLVSNWEQNVLYNKS